MLSGLLISLMPSFTNNKIYRVTEADSEYRQLSPLDSEAFGP